MQYDNPKALPLVSIIIGTYNAGIFLEAQLQSVLNQTYPNIEIIIVDDCSTDNTRNTLKTFAGNHKNVQLFFNEKNLGYIKNFEKGCRLSSGDYISFCDQDDIWDADKTAIEMEQIGNYAMIYCDDYIVDKDLNVLKKHSDLKNLRTYTNCLCFATDNCVGGHNLIMKREIFDAAFPFHKAMPYDLWCAFIATFYGGVKYVDKPMIKWRQHGNNVTSATNNNKEKEAETRERLKLFFNACPANFKKEKNVLGKLSKSYESLSLPNNFMRMFLFFKYKKYLLAMKKKSEFRKVLFCIKMFFKIRLHVA